MRIHSNSTKNKCLWSFLLDIRMGTLIMGKSGIGKSETALELIKRGQYF